VWRRFHNIFNWFWFAIFVANFLLHENNWNTHAKETNATQDVEGDGKVEENTSQDNKKTATKTHTGVRQAVNFCVICFTYQFQLQLERRLRLRRSFVVCCATAAWRAGRLRCEVNSASDDFKLTSSEQIFLYAGRCESESALTVFVQFRCRAHERERQLRAWQSASVVGGLWCCVHCCCYTRLTSRLPLWTLCAWRRCRRRQRWQRCRRQRSAEEA